MSYILDALRKSEQERHREQLPASGSSRLVMPARAPKPTGIKMLLVAVLLINAVAIGAGAIYLFNRADEPQPVAAFSPEEPSLPDNEGDQDWYPEAPMPRNGLPLPQRVVPVEAMSDFGDEPSSILPDVGYVNAPDSSTLSERLDRRLEQLRPRDRLAEVPNVTNRDQQPARQSAQQTQPASSLPDDIIRPSDQRNNPPARQAAATAPPAVSEAPAVAATAVVSAPAAQDINTLPDDFRRQLPALTFNSHIYSSDPGSRRIMINNAYLREGQRFEGLSIREITGDGVILYKSPHTFSVPVIRDWKP